MNQISLMGRLTKDPEQRFTKNGTEVSNFTLAVHRAYKKDGEEKNADFITIRAYGNLANICNKYLKKGSKPGIIGRLNTDSSEREGQRYFYTYVVLESIDLPDKKTISEESEEAIETWDMDIPF